MKKQRMIFLAALLVLCSCADFGADPGEVGATVPRAGAPKELPAAVGAATLLYGRSFLTEEEQAVYDRLWQACEQYDLSVRFAPPDSLDSERFLTLAGYFADDNPAFYWARPVWAEGADGHWITLSLLGEWDADELRRRDAEIERAALAMLDGVPQNAPECVYAVHDRLVERVNYDGGNLREDSENIYGALVKRYAVCDGYARAFQYLMQRRGVDCVWLRGSSARGVAHAWNAVRLADGWYYVDVTWDATDPWRRKTYHNYLGLTLEEMARAHLFDAGQYPALPPADSRTYNYHVYHRYAVEPEAGNEVRQLATAFANRLEAADIPEEWDRVFLDIKIYADAGEYERVKDLFVKNIYAVVRAAGELAEQRGMAVDIDTVGEVRCNFSDEQQVLTLLPRVRQK